MSTVQNLVTSAFGKVGVDSPTAAQTASALVSLNNIVTFWGADQLNYSVTRESFALTINDPEYTVGSAGNFNTARPMKISTCYLQNADGYDFPVRVMSARDYAAINSKSIVQRPTRVYFIPEYPLAKIIFNSYPDYAYTAYFEFVKSITAFASVTATCDLPGEYNEALVYNLAMSLAEDWDRAISKTVVLKAEKCKETILQMNAAAKAVPLARFDMGVSGGIGDYNIASDELMDGGAF